MKLKRFFKIDLFMPESFLLFYTFFILITLLSFLTDLPLAKPSLLSFILIFVTFPFYLLGIEAGNFVYGKKIPQLIVFACLFLISIFYTLVFANFYNFNLPLSFILCAGTFAILYLSFFEKEEVLASSVKAPAFLSLIGLAFLFFSFFQEGGFPLLDPALKINFLYNPAFGISILFFIFGFVFLMPQIKDNEKFAVILIVATLLFLLSAFRGTVLAIFLTGAFIAYYGKKLDNKKIIFALLTALLIIVLVGYLARPMFNPLNLFLYRAGTTHTVFDRIVQESMPFGHTHGTLFFYGSPRDFVAKEIMRQDANLTYTVLGAPFLDFGIIGGILWMLFMGMILQLSYLSMKLKGLAGFYPLLFSISLVFIEIGIDQFFLLFFFIFLVYYFTKKNKASWPIKN